MKDSENEQILVNANNIAYVRKEEENSSVILLQCPKCYTSGRVGSRMEVLHVNESLALIKALANDEDKKGLHVFLLLLSNMKIKPVAIFIAVNVPNTAFA